VTVPDYQFKSQLQVEFADSRFDVPRGRSPARGSDETRSRSESVNPQAPGFELPAHHCQWPFGHSIVAKIEVSIRLLQFNYAAAEEDSSIMNGP